MDSKRLKGFISGLEDAPEHVLARGIRIDPVNPLLHGWRAAAAESRRAYAEWRRCRDAASYARYRACADQADAAQDALAAGWA